MTTILRVLAVLAGLGFLVVPVLEPVGWWPLVSIFPAVMCFGLAVFGCEE